jgi:Glycoside hydrolase family 44
MLFLEMKLKRGIVTVVCLLLGVAGLRLWVGEAQGPTIAVNIDAAANRRPINPNIYGVAFATSVQLTDLNSPLNRSGGNATSQYNWQCNCDNRGSDWYFESLDDGSATAGKINDDFVSATKAGGAQAMLTIPTIGWVAKLGLGRGKLSSFSIAKYGAQKDNDWQWFPDAGNGLRQADGSKITGNNPNDANIPADSTFQQGWMQHLVSKWGAASSGGFRYYLLDNEPGLWQETHRDVHPIGPTMDEIKSDIIDYGAKVKATDPSALVVAPEEWGWPAYLYSGYDWQWAGAHNNYNPATFPDRTAHGGADYLPWILDQLHQHDTQTGQRSLDVLTVHWYPQGSQALGLPNEAFSNDVSTAMSQLRNRSTRSLWDPNYTDESWINRKVYVIPRIRGWVNQYYPGLQTGITEYNWGAEPYINGATAQADIFGIFGREGLDMATLGPRPMRQRRRTKR